MYLDRADVLAVLADIAAGAAPGTAVVFDYVVSPAAVADPAIRGRYEALAARLAAIGEPWRSFFDPHELDQALRRAGFAQVWDWDGAALDARYFAGRRDGLGVGPTAHLIAAIV